jgi:outer membrane usher protein
VTTDAVSGVQRSTLTAAGALTAIGGGLHLSRPIRDSFGLIDLNGLDDVRVMVSNAPVGRTRRGGRLLVPNLLSYYSNDVSIADEDVPLDWDVPARRTLIAPALRGGAVIHLQARPVRPVTGRVRITDHGIPVTGAFGALVVAIGGQRVESPIGSDGQFYFEDLVPGVYDATLATDTFTATCRLDIPVSAAPVLYLDDVVCAVVG